MFRNLSAAVLLLICVAVPANADILTTFDNPGDVTLSPTQAPGTWYIDRYAPAGFSAGQTAPDGRLGTLLQSISAADNNAGRPPAFSSNFYNTQGRKYDLAAGTASLGIQLYVPSAWNSLSQNIPGAEGRLASFWATAADNSHSVTAFPIIEFNNNVNGAGADGFRVWDSATGTWVNVGGFTGFDNWYYLGFELSGSNLNYYINGSLVSTLGNLGTTHFDNVILQGYNAGNSYNINWDNLSNQATTSVPEPATFVIMALVLACCAACYFYRQRRVLVPVPVRYSVSRSQRRR